MAMGLKSIIVLLILLIFILLSLRERIHLSSYRQTKKFPQEPVSSLVSQAIANLVGVAGGIYLSLVMVTSFLGLTYPETIEILGFSLEPLAFISLFIAIVQPWLSKIYYSFYR